METKAEFISKLRSFIVKSSVLVKHTDQQMIFTEDLLQFITENNRTKLTNTSHSNHKQNAKN